MTSVTMGPIHTGNEYIMSNIDVMTPQSEGSTLCENRERCERKTGKLLLNCVFFPYGLIIYECIVKQRAHYDRIFISNSETDKCRSTVLYYTSILHRNRSYPYL